MKSLESKLIEAIKDGVAARVIDAINDGADVNAVKKKALFHASESGNLHIFDYVISVIDNVSYDEMYDCMICAAQSGSLMIVRKIINSNNFYISRKHGSPFLESCMHNRINVVSYLLREEYFHEGDERLGIEIANYHGFKRLSKLLNRAVTINNG